MVTGSPGFIGANLVLRLLKDMNGGVVISLDNMNDYYDVGLKKYRLDQIEEIATNSPVKHIFIKGNIADRDVVADIFRKYQPDIVVKYESLVELTGCKRA